MEIKKGTLAYTYLFNYFGKNKFKKKTITGAAIDLAIKVIKNIFDKISAQEPVTTNKIKEEAEKEIHLGYDAIEQINVPSDSNETGGIGIELDEL